MRRFVALLLLSTAACAASGRVTRSETCRDSLLAHPTLRAQGGVIAFHDFTTVADLRRTFAAVSHGSIASGAPVDLDTRRCD